MQVLARLAFSIEWLFGPAMHRIALHGASIDVINAVLGQYNVDRYLDLKHYRASGSHAGFLSGVRILQDRPDRPVHGLPATQANKTGVGIRRSSLCDFVPGTRHAWPSQSKQDFCFPFRAPG